MNKKKAAAVAAVLLVAYGGGTWYLGERAHKGIEEAMAQVQGHLGSQAVVSHAYERGFWTSKDRLVLQINPPASAAAVAPAAQPVRITVDSTVRHGPIAGLRLAAAVIESRFSIQGLDETAQKALAQVTAPTLTTVRGLGGGYGLAFALPAGEVASADQTLRWQALSYSMHMDAAQQNFSGTLRWLEISVLGTQPKAASARRKARGPEERFALDLKGMQGDFEMRSEDGLWLLGPGTGTLRMDRVLASHSVGSAAAKNVVDLQDLKATSTVKRTDNTLGWTTTTQARGGVGPLVLDALQMEETVDRISIDALKTVQSALVTVYRDAAVHSANSSSPQAFALWGEAAQPFFAALPSYAMKLSATLEGQQATLEYGAQVNQAPSALEAQRRGWGASLLQGSTVSAALHMPRTMLPVVAQSLGQKDLPPEQIDALLRAGVAQGFLRQEGDRLSSALKLEGGRLELNGKPMALPPMALPGR